MEQVPSQVLENRNSPVFCLPLPPLSSQALLSCQLGLLPPPQLFLYIWGQEGELEVPYGDWNSQLCSWLSRKESQP